MWVPELSAWRGEGQGGGRRTGRGAELGLPHGPPRGPACPPAQQKAHHVGPVALAGDTEAGSAGRHRPLRPLSQCAEPQPLRRRLSPAL